MRELLVSRARCSRCGACSGHHRGCDRNYWRLPRLSTPKRGSAAWDRLHASVMLRIAEGGA